MTKSRSLLIACAATVAGIAGLAIGENSALAYVYEGQGASPGGVIAAKAIGKYCSGSLSASEIGELDAYLAKAAKEWLEGEEAKKQKNKDYQPLSFEKKFVDPVTDVFAKKYSDPKNCGAGATEAARDMVQRVRGVMASGAPALIGDSKVAK